MPLMEDYNFIFILLEKSNTVMTMRVKKDTKTNIVFIT